MQAMRPDLMSLHHVVVSGHYLTAQAGFQILEAGGNAIDAGVAVGIATSVVECEFVGFGGIAPSMIHLTESREIVTLSGMGCWPHAASSEYFRDNHGGRIPAGLMRTVVPAAPDTWITALEKFGTMSFGEVSAAAIRFARDGFAMYPMMRDRFEGEAENLAKWPSSATIFLPGGRLPEIGKIFVQSDLAATLQYLADEEAVHAKKGREAGLQAARDAFYKGDVAATIVQHQKENGGQMTAEDMAGFRITIDPPCHTRFGDIDLYGCGPISQGPMLLETLGILAGVDLVAMGHNSPQYIHTVVEALKLAAADREAYFGDPLFVDVPAADLLSEDYLAERRKMIRSGEAWPGTAPCRRGGRCHAAALGARSLLAARPGRGGPRDLVFLCHGPSRQRLFSDPQRRSHEDSHRAGNRPQRFDVGIARLYWRQPPVQRRAGQAPQDVVQPRHRHSQGKDGHGLRLARRRGDRPGDDPGIPQRERLRHGFAGGSRGSALRQL